MAAQLSPWHQISSSPTPLVFFKPRTAYPNHQRFYPCRRTARVTAAAEGSAKKQSKSTKGNDDDSAGTPSWAKPPGSDELLPWARQEAQKNPTGIEVPFFVYLLASAVTAIAAIGSIFEYVNQIGQLTMSI